MDEEQQRTSPTALAVVLTLLGLVLVGFGMFALVAAILAAWDLYRQPEGIGYFADYVIEVADLSPELETAGREAAHAVAWVLVVLLLLLLGRLGAWAVAAGGQLVGPRLRRGR